MPLALGRTGCCLLWVALACGMCPHIFMTATATVPCSTGAVLTVYTLPCCCHSDPKVYRSACNPVLGSNIPVTTRTALIASHVRSLFTHLFLQPEVIPEQQGLLLIYRFLFGTWSKAWEKAGTYEAMNKP